MNFGQAFKLAAKSIGAKKGRSALTMLGIIIGIAAVIILVSYSKAQTVQWMAYINGLGDNVINISASSWNSEGVSDAIYDYCLKLDDYILGVTPNVGYYRDAAVTYGTKTINGRDAQGNYDWNNRPNIMMGNQDYSLCANYKLAKGRDISYLDVQKYSQVCILGSKIAEQLFNYADPIGKTVTIAGNPFEVIGVYESKATMEWDNTDMIVVLPYTMNRMLNGTTEMDSFIAKARDKDSTTKAVTLLSGFLEGLIDPNFGYSYVETPNQQQEQAEDSNKMQEMFLAGIAGISLLVSGIGIMNIMLVTVTERTREIGIRKAIGAERKSIIVQFLIEACMICCLGGILGILLGYLGTLILCKVAYDIIYLPDVGVAVFAFLFSLGMGVVFGLYPAIKASGLQPVVALRAE